MASFTEAGSSDPDMETEDWDTAFEAQKMNAGRKKKDENEDEDQHETIKLSSVGDSATLARLREASMSSRKLAGKLSSSGLERWAETSGAGGGGCDWDTDSAEIDSGIRQANIDRSFEDDFEFEDGEADLLARSVGAGSSLSGRSSMSTLGTAGGTGGALSSTDWTEPESPSMTASSGFGSKMQSPISSASPILGSRLSPFASSGFHKPNKSLQLTAPMPPADVTAVFEAPDVATPMAPTGATSKDKSSLAREAGMLGVDEAGSSRDLEDDFDFGDDSTGGASTTAPLSLSPALALARKQSISILSPSESLRPHSNCLSTGTTATRMRALKNQTSHVSLASTTSFSSSSSFQHFGSPALRPLTVASSPESSSSHARQSSKSSTFSDASSKFGFGTVSSHADEDDVHHSAQDDGDDEHEEEEDPLEGLVLPGTSDAGPRQPSSSTPQRRDSEQQRSISAASLRAMLKARKKGLLMSNSSSSYDLTAGGNISPSGPVSPRGSMGRGEDALSGLVITNDGDLSPGRLAAAARKNRERGTRQRKNRTASADPSTSAVASGSGVVTRSQATATGNKARSGPPPSASAAANAAYLPTSRNFNRKVSMPDLGSSIGGAAGAQSMNSRNAIGGSRRPLPLPLQQQQEGAAAQAPARRLFSPASQIFTRALASTEAFKDRKMPPSPRGPPPKAMSRQTPSESVPADIKGKRAEPHQRMNSSSSDQHGGTATRSSMAAAQRYTVSTASQRRKTGPSSTRPPLTLDVFEQADEPPPIPAIPTEVRLREEPGLSTNTAETTTSDELAADDVSAHLPVKPPHVLRRPKRGRNYGDGTELDAFEDLSTTPARSGGVEHRSVRVNGRLAARGLQAALGAPPAMPRRASAQSFAIATVAPSQTSDPPEPQETPARMTRSAARRRKAKAKAGSISKPMLIKNLGGAPSTEKAVGEMRWNPTLQRWEGNEQDVKSFDDVLGSSSRPALITQFSSAGSMTALASPTLMRHRSGSVLEAPECSPLAARTTMAAPPDTDDADLSVTPSLILKPRGAVTAPRLSATQVVGDMSFDPVKMCWVKISGEEEEDPFADLGSTSDEDHYSSTAATTAAAEDTPLSTTASLITSGSVRSAARKLEGSQAEEDATSSAVSVDFDDGVSSQASAAGKSVTLPEGLALACRDAQRVHDAEMRRLFRERRSSMSAFEFDRSHLHLLPRLLSE